MNITILGAGAYGTAIASVLIENKINILTNI
jgi:glycerol-3-phosphate dehydrogenase